MNANSPIEIGSGRDGSHMECDDENLHLLGGIQGDAGHVLFITFPEGKIVAADAKIRSIPWVEASGLERLAKKQRTTERTGSALRWDRDSSSDSNGVGGRSSGNGSDGSESPLSLPSLMSTTKNSLTHNQMNHHNDQNSQRDSAYEMLGTQLRSWIPSHLYSDIQDAISKMVKEGSRRSFRFFNHCTGSYAISLSPIRDDYSMVGIEVEHLNDTEERSSGSFCGTLLSLSRIMEFYADEDLIKTTCDTIFRLMRGNYDRGMVYRFNHDLTGEIIHEIKDENIQTSYLNMRFPAGDIPLPARRLFLKNGLRYIENVNAKDVPILNDRGQCDMDLSHVRMRAVSIHHIRYLQNMGVVSSMSLAIKVNDQLWGLLSFHGYNHAFKPPLQLRIACETIATMVSVKLEAIEKKEESTRIIQLSTIMKEWEVDHSVIRNLTTLGKQMMKLLDADILVGRIKDPTLDEAEILIIGDESLAPREGFWPIMARQLKRKILSCNTHAGIAELGLTTQDLPASGFTFYQDGLVQLMFGRCVRSKDVIWGGNPDEPKVRKDGKLCPRNSFEAFMEKAHSESRAWTKSDLHLVDKLTETVSEHSHNRMVTLLKHDIEEANHRYFCAIERARDNCEFFAQMSHEIRTPFHGVMGCLDILQDAKNMDDDDIQDMVNTALASGNHMISLLNDILDISKNEYGNNITLLPVDYMLLASEAVLCLRSLALNHGIKFSHDIRQPEHHEGVILTDKTKFIQVVSNIINNAIKFSPNGSIDVKVQLTNTLTDAVSEWEEVAKTHEGSIFTSDEHSILTSPEAVKAHVANTAKQPNQKWVLVSVTDSGCGMESHEISEMMKPYTQSSNGSTRSFQGTGLGLFICLSLCKQLNGFLACSSTKGVGSTFQVGLPVGLPSKGENHHVEQLLTLPDSYKVPDAPSPVMVRDTIAVVDDNKVNVKILVRTLQNECKKVGIDVELITAEGGQEAFELYKERRPTLMFIDYHMPEVDGLQATQMIRQYEMDHGLAPSFIMSYTADATDKTANLLLANGTNEIMTKPSPKGFLTQFVKRMKQVHMVDKKPAVDAVVAVP